MAADSPRLILSDGSSFTATALGGKTAEEGRVCVWASSAGANIIPDFARFNVDTRSFDNDVQQAALKADKFILVLECQSSEAPNFKKLRLVSNFQVIEFMLRQS